MTSAWQNQIPPDKVQAVVASVTAVEFIAFIRDRHVWIPPGKKRPVCKLCGTAIDPDAPDEPLHHARDRSCGLAQEWLQQRQRGRR